MNQRIKQLAEQARQDYLKHHWPSGLSNNSVGMYPQLMERFAELIVRECIDIVSPYANRMENFDGGHPIADLKKHFGVEE